MQRRPSRPFGVTLLAILAILVGIIGLFGSLVIFALSAVAGSFLGSAVASIGVIVGSAVMIFSLIWLLVGWGFASGKGWAWILGMIYTVISLVIALGSLAVNPGGGVIGILIWGLMIYYLTRPGVKAFFGKSGFPSTYTAFPVPTGYGTPGTTRNILPPAAYAPSPAPTASPTNVPPGTVTQAIVLNPLAKESSIPLSEATRSAGTGGPALVSCPHCGSRLAIGSSKCSVCGKNI